jgi:phosphoribosylanthranilate isomerase
MIIKICGITRESDLEACARSGVQWVGLNLWEKSPRYLPEDRALALAQRAHEMELVPVAVIVQPAYETLLRLRDSGLFPLFQLYGVEDPPEGIEWIRPVAVKTPEDLEVTPSSARYDLLDTAHSSLGGTGRAFPWAYLEGRRFSRPTLIAGGITPENLRELFGFIHPFGIDVASGVELSPGIKDPRKIERLCEEVRRFVPLKGSS